MLPLHLEDLVVQSMRQYEDILEEGALIVVDESSARARILPLSGTTDFAGADACLVAATDFKSAVVLRE